MANNIQSNNRRIAKNTLMLYIRMAFVMFANLFVARIILSVLGEEDYGIYNVVGGVVVMFSFLSKTLASSSQRYFAFELGRGDNEKLSRVFNVTFLLYIIVSLFIIVLSETIGLWFLNTQMTIPNDRLFAANVIYQISILSFVVSLLATPFQAMIIATEKMSVYAYLGILEACLNLIIAGVLLTTDSEVDLLILYGILMLIATFIINFAYYSYSKKRNNACVLKVYWDKKLVVEIASYSGWNLFGAMAGIIRSQGINILINMFFNPVINAARGLAYHINNAVNSFAFNFYTAVRPQITKYYAANEIEPCFNLVFISSKLTYYLLLLFAIPMMVFSQEILDIWLAETPTYTSIFIQLVMIVTLIDSVSNPLNTLAQANGNIKKFQIVAGSLLMMNLPLSYFLLKMGLGVEFTLYVAIFMAILALFGRLTILKQMVGFPVVRYVRDVLLRILFTSVFAYGVCIIIKNFVYTKYSSIVMLVALLTLSVVSNVIIISLLGISSHEKKKIVTIVKQQLRN